MRSERTDVRPHPMSETPTIHGTCDPRFAHMRDVFAENFRERDEVGAAVALTLDGHPVSTCGRVTPT